MEFVDGSDLAVLVKKQGPLRVEKAVDCILQAARGLEYAHKRGVVHRDIKPANLLLDSEGVVKILDMGLARLTDAAGADPAAELTASGTIMGTVDYMAPEQALNTKHADARSDLYSLGCTLHYLLTGKTPYSGETMMERLLAHRTEPLPELTSVAGAVPGELQAIFARLAAKEPGDRYQQASELVADLEACGQQLREPSIQQPASSTAAENNNFTFLREASAAPRRASTRKTADSATRAEKRTARRGAKLLRRPWVVAAAAIGCMILMLIAAVSFWPRGTPRETSPKTAAGTLFFKTAGYSAWEKHVRSLSAGDQLEEVTKKLRELNPDFVDKLYDRDWNRPPQVVDGRIPVVALNVDHVTDLSPLRAIAGLKSLLFPGSTSRISKLADLSPLAGLDLDEVGFYHSQVRDLSPLAGMRLTSLICGGSPISDLSPLREMRLKSLDCSLTEVYDLAPLAKMPLEDFKFDPGKITAGLEPIRGKQSITAIGIFGNTSWPPAVFWQRYDAGEFGKPVPAAANARSPGLFFQTPAYAAWEKAVPILAGRSAAQGRREEAGRAESRLRRPALARPAGAIVKR